MAKIKVDSIAFDLMAFRKIADFLVAGLHEASLRAIAGKLDVSTTAVTKCLQRLERHFGCSLVTARPRGHEGMSLTAHGLELYEKIAAIGSRDLLRRHEQSRIHISHSLLTSDFLGPLLCDIVLGRSSRNETIQRLIHPSVSSMLFADVLVAFRDRSLDLALVYTSDRRRNLLTSEFDCRNMGPSIPTALVSRSSSMLQNVSSDLGEIFNDEPRFTFAGLPEDIQPVPASFPSDWHSRRCFLQVSTFDAAVALVRSGIVDYSIVPIICQGLLQDRMTGRICYRELPDVTLKISLISLKGTLAGEKVPNAQSSIKLAQLIEQQLEKVSVPTHASFPSDFQFTTDAAWYESLTYAYYIDHESSDLPVAKWLSERVYLSRDQGKNVSQLRFNGRIDNCRGAAFQIRDAMLIDKLFFVVAEKVNNEVSSATSFITVFNQCRKEEGVMCGVWSGKNVNGDRVLNATIWSQRKLSLGQLIQYADAVSWLITSNSGSSSDDAIDIRTQ